MAYKQNAGRGNESPKAPIAMHGPLHQKKEKMKKFSVKLGEKGMDKLEEKGISHYTTGKSGKFLSGDSYNKVHFNVPKSVFKSNPDYKLLRGEGRYQKLANTVGVLSLSGLVDGLIGTRNT